MKRFATTSVLSAALIAAAFSPVNAEVVVMNAYENSSVSTSFELVFPDLGINSSSNVFFTRYKLEIDEERGTARFVDYIQQIDPLMLPLGISTGRLDIRITSSEGTYDAATQTFETQDVYEITFRNDLRTFGFESPVLLPAVSKGTLSGPAASARSVEMRWEGDGELANSENPAAPYKFTYTCRSTTTVAASAADVPPLPTRGLCAEGILSFFGFAAMGLMFAGLKASNRRLRR